MRKYKFRGKVVDGNYWVSGDLLQNDDSAVILTAYDCVDVEPDSVGLFTGMIDRNGQEVYEGDIVRYENIAKLSKRLQTGPAGVVKWNDEEACFVHWDGFTDCALPPCRNIVVLGNIIDNPDILKSDKK